MRKQKVWDEVRIWRKDANRSLGILQLDSVMRMVTNIAHEITRKSLSSKASMAWADLARISLVSDTAQPEKQSWIG